MASGEKERTNAEDAESLPDRVGVKAGRREEKADPSQNPSGWAPTVKQTGGFRYNATGWKFEIQRQVDA